MASGSKLLIVAGVLCAASLLAQPVLTVYPVPKPATDTGVPLAPPHAAAVTVPSTPEAWGGARTGEEATLSDRVADYRIEATLDPIKHTVDGREILTWRNRSKIAVRNVYMHLYLNAFEGEGSTYNTERRQGGVHRSNMRTKPGEWGFIDLQSVTQGGQKVRWDYAHPDGGPATDHTVVRLELPEAVPAGGSTQLDIAFHDQLPRVTARTGYFGSFHLVAQWFPKIGVLELPGERGAQEVRWNAHEFHLASEFYADFGSYDVKLTVPKDYTVGATGALQGTPAEADGMLTHHYAQGDVHDFAWTADKRSAPPLQDKWKDVDVRVLYPPEYKASAEQAMKTAKDSLAWFSDTLGPYPYKTLTVVIPPFNAQEAGGMEYPTFITADGLPDVDEKTLDRFKIDFVTIHEFGHGYFYGILASNEFEEPMLDEGLNEYWDYRMVRARKQLVYLADPMTKKLGIAPGFESFEVVRYLTDRDRPLDHLGANAYERIQSIGQVYSRTATTMRDLEERIGKEAMEKGFREYYRRWKFRHPSVADLREALADGSGQRAAVEAVFAQQVYQVQRIDDRVVSLTSEEELPQPGTRVVDGKRIEDSGAAIERQVKDARKAWSATHPDAKEGGPFQWRTTVTLRRHGAPVPQTVLVRFADGSSEKVVWDDQRQWARFSWTRPAKAISAELDPERKHYLDVSKLDDSLTAKPDRSASRHWGGELAALVQLIASLIALV